MPSFSLLKQLARLLFLYQVSFDTGRALGQILPTFSTDNLFLSVWKMRKDIFLGNDIDGRRHHDGAGVDSTNAVNYH